MTVKEFRYKLACDTAAIIFGQPYNLTAQDGLSKELESSVCFRRANVPGWERTKEWRELNAPVDEPTQHPKWTMDAAKVIIRSEEFGLDVRIYTKLGYKTCEGVADIIYRSFLGKEHNA